MIEKDRCAIAESVTDIWMSTTAIWARARYQGSCFTEYTVGQYLLSWPQLFESRIVAGQRGRKIKQWRRKGRA